MLLKKAKKEGITDKAKDSWAGFFSPVVGWLPSFHWNTTKQVDHIRHWDSHGKCLHKSIHVFYLVYVSQLRRTFLGHFRIKSYTYSITFALSELV